MVENKARELYKRRARRNRYSLRKNISVNPRLSVFRSSKHIYAQIIDDSEGLTLVSASSVEKSMKSMKTGADIQAASKIGGLVAERALKKGLKSVVFDRGGYRYHGRVKALADAARTAGLKF